MAPFIGGGGIPGILLGAQQAGPPALDYPGQVLADGPLAYYRLGETSGTAMLDSSGNGRDGAYVNNPTLGVAGPTGDGDGAVTFNGTSQYGQVASAAWMDAVAITVEAWIKTTEATGVRSILDRFGVSGQRAFQFRMNAGRLELLRQTSAGSNGTVVSDGVINSGTWRHVAATYDGSTVVLCIDGVVDKAVALAGGIRPTSTTALRVGVSESATGLNQHFPGSIGEAAYYGTALSPERLGAHYQAA